MVQSGVVFTSQQAHTTLRRTLEDDTNAIKKSVKHNSLLDDLHTSIVLSSQIKLRSINARYWADAHPTSFLFSSFTLIWKTRGGIFTIFRAIASKLKVELSGAERTNEILKTSTVYLWVCMHITKNLLHSHSFFHVGINSWARKTGV